MMVGAYSARYAGSSTSLRAVNPSKWTSKIRLRFHPALRAETDHSSPSLSKVLGVLRKSNVAVLVGGFSQVIRLDASEKTRMSSLVPKSEETSQRNSATSRSSRC